MNEIIRKIEQEQLKDNVVDFKVGDTIRVHALIKEGNRERIQVFEGTVLKRQGGGAKATFTVRRICYIRRLFTISKWFVVVRFVVRN